MTIEIVELRQSELCQHSWRLLLLADPNKALVNGYIERCDIYLAKYSDEIVGICALQRECEEELVYEIKNIAVDPKVQNKGIARQLLNHTITIAKNQQAELKICTANTSQLQIALYKSAGFTITSIEKGYFLENYPDAIYENGEQCEDRVVMYLNNLSYML